MLVGIFAASLVWIYDRERERIPMCLIGQMMVGHDHIHSVFACPGAWFKAPDAAIDRDAKRKSVSLGLFQSGNVYAVSLSKSIWNMESRFSPEHLQRPTHQYRAGCAVDIIVAPDKDLFFIFDSSVDTVCRLSHAL